MRSAEVKLLIILLVLVLVFIRSQGGVFQKVSVTVINGLGSGKILNIHCLSKDDDLGRNAISYGHSISWSFRDNLWGATLFYCDADWPESPAPKRFYAYSHKRDGRRCHSECIWMIAENGLLYGRNPDSGSWDFLPYQTV